MGIIHSRLMKADYLVGNSEVFPVLVRAACSQVCVAFGPDVVAHVAALPTVLDMLEAQEDTTLDHTLRALAGDKERAHDLDSTILGAVHNYKEQNNGA